MHIAGDLVVSGIGSLDILEIWREVDHMPLWERRGLTGQQGTYEQQWEQEHGEHRQALRGERRYFLELKYDQGVFRKVFYSLNGLKEKGRSYTCMEA